MPRIHLDQPHLTSQKMQWNTLPTRFHWPWLKETVYERKRSPECLKLHKIDMCFVSSCHTFLSHNWLCSYTAGFFKPYPCRKAIQKTFIYIERLNLHLSRWATLYLRLASSAISLVFSCKVTCVRIWFGMHKMLPGQRSTIPYSGYFR